MFEHRHQPLISRSAFVRRISRHFLVAFGIVAGSLLLGMVGYHGLEGLSWVDALVNSAMLLGGMGPVNELHTVAGKLFASFYALYSGLVFLIAAGVLLVPIAHRFLHHFHINLEEEDDAAQ
jgi:hypothetical protein